ncbi:MAG: helix-turn-helix domain-containing protein [Streptosporangiaceae bacterium]
MSIGATLAAARRRSGLTLSEVSDRAGVTEPIIRGIEQDDYAACGGDSIARAHIRAIAGALGEDPVPLMDEFDERWRSAVDGSADDGAILPGTVTTLAAAFPPARPARTRERRRVRWSAVLAVLVLAVLGFASYEFVAGVGRAHHADAAITPRPTHVASLPATLPPVTPSAQLTSAQPSLSPTPSPTPVAVRTLTPASVAAFGPAGTADGDNPQTAARSLSGDPATPWVSDWYADPDLNNQAGTGLLVDMGRSVTITSVRVSLAGRPGADLQIRVGGSPVPSDLRSVARSSGAGGAIRLSLTTPVKARYLLIWFTLLPPDASGTYQASVYDITVQGQP